jgi:hypothetical protein
MEAPLLTGWEPGRGPERVPLVHGVEAVTMRRFRGRVKPFARLPAALTAPDGAVMFDPPRGGEPEVPGSPDPPR